MKFFNLEIKWNASKATKIISLVLIIIVIFHVLFNKLIFNIYYTLQTESVSPDSKYKIELYDGSNFALRHNALFKIKLEDLSGNVETLTFEDEIISQNNTNITPSNYKIIWDENKAYIIIYGLSGYTKVYNISFNAWYGTSCYAIEVDRDINDLSDIKGKFEYITLFTNKGSIRFYGIYNQEGTLIDIMVDN